MDSISKLLKEREIAKMSTNVLKRKKDVWCWALS